MVKIAPSRDSKSTCIQEGISLPQGNKKELVSVRRRSGRQKIAPVEYWNGAAVRYDDDGTLIGVECVGALASSELYIADNVPNILNPSKTKNKRKSRTGRRNSNSNPAASDNVRKNKGASDIELSNAIINANGVDPMADKESRNIHIRSNHTRKRKFRIGKRASNSNSGACDHERKRKRTADIDLSDTIINGADCFPTKRRKLFTEGFYQNLYEYYKKRDAE